MPLPASGYPVALAEFDGQPVPPDAVRSVELETNVGFLADSLTLVLDNAALYSDFLRKEQAVNLWLGYVGDPRHWGKGELVHVFGGAVDGVLPSFADDRTVTIRARDHARALIDSQADPGWSWANLDHAALVTRLAEQAGLTPDVQPAPLPFSTEEEEAFLGGGYVGNPQVGMSGWDICQTLAVRDGFVCYVTADKRLYWGPRKAEAPPVGTWTYLEPPHDLLAAGLDDSALVVNAVSVGHWVGVDDANPQGYVSGRVVDAGRLKAARGRVVEKALVDSSVHTVQECETRAKAILVNVTAAAITGTATVEGSPLVLGDCKVRLAGKALGRFAGDYYLDSAVHRFTTDGYDTDLRLSSVRPEAFEVYRESLGALTPDEAAALKPDGPTPVQPGPCTGGPSTDYAAEWPEFGGPVARLLQENGIAQAIGTEDATCGPIAAAGLLKAYGITTDPGKLAARAYTGGGPNDRWWTGGGMAGPASLVKLLESQGLKATNLGRDITAAKERAIRCVPVIFDTAGAGGGVGHYILASAYQPEGALFFGGVTISNAMKRSGGNPWASVAQIESYGLGSIRDVIVADAPLPTGVGASAGGITAAAYPLGAVPAGLVDAAPARLRAAIRKDGRWPAAEWDNAAAVSFNETGGSWKETAHKDDAIEDSRGVFQVNVRPNANPQYASWNLFDYDTCAEAAYQIWRGWGNSWRAWSVAPGLGLA